MSFFGPNVKASEVSDNPYYLPANSYYCFVKDVNEVEKDGKRLLTFEYAIDDVTNKYNGKAIRQVFNMPPAELTLDQLDAKQNETLSWLKRLLRRGFGLSEEQIEETNPSDVMGHKVIVTTVLNAGTGVNEGKEFVNVRDVVTPEAFEEAVKSDQTAEALGL